MEKNKVNKEQVIKIVKKVLSIIGFTLLGLLVVMTIWLAIDKFIIQSPVPSFLGFSILRVETGSMSGTINEGDVIVIFKTNDYKIGDIVTFIQDGDILPTTHRIVLYEGENGYITKGDFNTPTDANPIFKDEILGEYLFRIPKLGFILEWLTTTEGIIYTVIFIIVLYGVIFLWRKKETDDNEESEDLEDDVEEVTDDNQGN